MDLRSGKVLVTGAGGFIGSHLCEELVREGCAVRAFVRYNSTSSWGWLDTSPPAIRAGMEVVAGDVRDPYGVRAAVRGCDVVLHLAALIAIPFSYRSPAAYVETNITGTLNVLQAAQDLGVARVVHTSTSETYGTARYVPIDEEHPLQGQSPYAATKIGADQLALSFQRSFGTPVAVIRPFNAFGPRQSARAVIPTVITQLASGQRHVRLGALAPTRDFSFVADTVRGFLAVAAADGAIGQVINVGSGFEISVGAVALLIAEVMGRPIDITREEDRLRPVASEVERLCAANARARTVAGWVPTYAGHDGLRRGLEATVAWFLRPENLSRYKAELYNV